MDTRSPLRSNPDNAARQPQKHANRTAAENAAADAVPPAGISVAAWDQLASPQRYRLARVRIDRAEVLHYLGYTGQRLDSELAERIERIIAHVEETFEPRGAACTFAIDARGLDDAGYPCIRLAGTAATLTGRDIYRHLKDAPAACVLAATLGMESERQLRAQAGQSALDAAIFDAAASACVEAATETIDQAVKREVATFGLVGNTRFSCGYGDCPLDAQQGLLDALDARRALGITLTPSQLMLPSKSVTAIFGLFPAANGPVPQSDALRSCSTCRVRSGCAFRERGETCWGGTQTTRA